MIRENHYQDIIISLTPAAPARPLLIFAYWKNQDTGFWCGWAEPVLYTALVERRYYSRPVNEMPAQYVNRREYERDRARFLEPVAYDVNAPGGFSTLTGFTDEATLTETVDVVPADLDWEGLCDYLVTAEELLPLRLGKAS